MRLRDSMGGELLRDMAQRVRTERQAHTRLVQTRGMQGEVRRARSYFEHTGNYDARYIQDGDVIEWPGLVVTEEDISEEDQKEFLALIASKA
jgi:hypothetical protein